MDGNYKHFREIGEYEIIWAWYSKIFYKAIPLVRCFTNALIMDMYLKMY